MIHRRAFSLIELLISAGLLGGVCAMVAVMVAGNRAASSLRSDLADLRMIGQASAIYSDAHQGRLFTFSWRPGEVPATPNAELAKACADINPFTPSMVARAAVLQQLDLVTRNSDFQQITPDPAIAPIGHSPYVIYNHLVLAHFMGESLPSEIFFSARDAARSDWYTNTDDYLNDPANATYSPPTTGTTFESLWRWPFSSSYMAGPSHYSNDWGTVAGAPRTTERGSTQRQWILPSQADVLGNRQAHEVAHPSRKVLLFDDYDRYTGQHGQHFGLVDSRSTMAFYDGSVGRFATVAADYGFDPNNPDFQANSPDQAAAHYTYTPIAGWDPPAAVQTIVAAYYDQTRDGLQGIDFDQGSIRKPIRSSP